VGNLERFLSLQYFFHDSILFYHSQIFIIDYYGVFCCLQVFFSSAKGGSSCQIYFMTLNKPGMANWW